MYSPYSIHTQNKTVDSKYCIIRTTTATTSTIVLVTTLLTVHNILPIYLKYTHIRFTTSTCIRLLIYLRTITIVFMLLTNKLIRCTTSTNAFCSVFKRLVLI